VQRPPGVGQTLGLIGLLFVVFLLIDGGFAVLVQGGVEVSASTVLLARLIFGWSLVLFVAKRLVRTEWREAFLLVPSRIWPSVAGLLIGLGVSLAILSLITWMPFPPPESAVRASEQLRATNQTSLAIAMLLVGPVAEEMFFRGLVFRAWNQRYGMSAAFVGSTLLFAILHVFSWQIIVALPLGLFLAWTVLKTGSVFPAILGHIGANTAPRLIDPILAVAGYTDSQIEMMDRVPLWITCIGFTALLFGAIFTSHSIRFR
jgi:membrane protease YdiL (CAAX protease family)